MHLILVITFSKNILRFYIFFNFAPFGIHVDSYYIAFENTFRNNLHR
jgi:hypothetical protein